VSFGARGELIFRSLAKGDALARIKTDGTGLERIPTESFLEKGDVSPDGEWVIVRGPATSGYPVGEAVAVSIRGGRPRTICRGNADSCTTAGWSPDAKFFYVGSHVNRTTFAIPVPAGKAIPDFPVGGITDLRQAAALPGGADDRRGPDLAGIRPLNLRVHEDKGLALSAIVVAGGKWS